ncbi:hypothetical protein LSUB1_G008296 [Lachnellula subtilissima]|uniref:Cupin type-2 domain-containing protein n=1 Tax=Lachnellula subtilissima TaxID=602034 RepID=A0A8H8U343_9HELO|nr:hypothetical protein LSUB1_G008296 [Lachnellula subtilissima]
MSSQIEEPYPLVLGKVMFYACAGDMPAVQGLTYRAEIPKSKLEDSPEHNWVETTYDGKEGSDVLAVPNHWHRDHDEIMEVLEGKMIFYLDGKEHPTSAGDPPITIPRGHIHGFTIIKGTYVRFIERTVPTGTFKALFFQDIFQRPGMPSFLMVMRAFYDGDAFPSLPGGFKWFDYLFITVVGFLAKAFVPGKPATVRRLGKRLDRGRCG